MHVLYATHHVKTILKLTKSTSMCVHNIITLSIEIENENKNQKKRDKNGRGLSVILFVCPNKQEMKRHETLLSINSKSIKKFCATNSFCFSQCFSIINFAICIPNIIIIIGKSTSSLRSLFKFFLSFSRMR